MATKKSKTLDEAIDDIMKDYKNVVKKAVTYAAIEARRDIYNYSMSCIEEYYNEYDPKRYKRSDSLRYSVLPRLIQYTEGDKIKTRVGVEYNPFSLEAYTQGNSAYDGSSHYTPVDPWYVIDNYLRGVHPATNGTRNEDDVVYREITFSPSPTEKMETYLENYVKTTFNDNIILGIARQMK
jgi:hypothetical protein